MRAEDGEDGWQQFLDLCNKVKSPKKFKAFFDLFSTIEEKETFAKRCLIVKALINGELTQREIAEKYNVSISQITRGSNAMKIIDNDLRKFLITHLKDKK